MAALDYRPHRAARALRSQPHLRDRAARRQPGGPAPRASAPQFPEYLGEVIAGCARACRPAGFHLVLELLAYGDRRRARRRPRRAARRSRARRRRAHPAAVRPAWLLDLLERRAIPFARLMPGAAPGHGLCFTVDDFAAARALTERLLAAGHRHLAFIAGPPDHLAARARREGFEAALAACPGARGADRRGRLLPRLGRARGRRGCSPAPIARPRCSPPTIRWPPARSGPPPRSASRVPRDLAVAGFDDSFIAGLTARADLGAPADRRARPPRRRQPDRRRRRAPATRAGRHPARLHDRRAREHPHSRQNPRENDCHDPVAAVLPPLAALAAVPLQRWPSRLRPPQPASCLPQGFFAGPAAYKSVEQLPDGRVTFRLCAPDAQEARVTSNDIDEAIPMGIQPGSTRGLVDDQGRHRPVDRDHRGAGPARHLPLQLPGRRRARARPAGHDLQPRARRHQLDLRGDRRRRASSRPGSRTCRTARSAGSSTGRARSARSASPRSTPRPAT